MKNLRILSKHDLMDLISENQRQIDATVRLMKIISFVLVALMAAAVIAARTGIT